ncbi:MAG: hypothetical protein QOD07_298 [Frankiaceae bacterium]|jgi:hypothetical protein|nr:hypothetical protein [Frankiaceae bacterium]
MIDPFVATTALLAFALTVAAVMLARSSAEPQQRATQQPAETTKRRHVNGGWH